MESDALAILKNTFGYDQFRGNQSDIIRSVCQGHDTLVVMPTGGGKSLCYQMPALLSAGITVVVSPLIALMQDQVDSLLNLGIKAAFINSSLPYNAVAAIEQNLINNKLDIIYFAPERLLQHSTLDLLSRCNISLFAVDEAHCVAQWGHDFRADYLRLGMLKEVFSSVPIIALTATADGRTQKEIIHQLRFLNENIFVSGFDRPNIQYRISQKNNPRKQLVSFLHAEHAEDAGIVYCLSRDKVEKTAIYLVEQGFNALPYHAGLNAQIRANNQRQFLREDGVIIVATIAFGMGIDKPDVRFVAHLDMPKSIEAYYQETGRAGRDSEPSTALLLYGFEDVVKLRQMMQNSEGGEMFKRHEQQRLNSMLGLCETSTCRRHALLNYFGDVLNEPCGNCDTCLIPPQTWDATTYCQMALSCVYRTGQRFGSGHIIDVLRGTQNNKVQQFNHHQLSVFGIGKELSVNEWRSILRQLVARAYLDIDAQGYGSLILTEQCRHLLRGEESLQLRRDVNLQSKTKKERKKDIDIEDSEMPLFQALRACRKKLADEYGVPSYIIFNDATLKDMILKKPVSLEQMLGVHGVGESKLNKFCPDFLDILLEFEFSQ